MVQCHQSIHELQATVYPSLQQNFLDHGWLCDRASYTCASIGNFLIINTLLCYT